MLSNFSSFKKQCIVAVLLLLAAAVIWSWAFNTLLFTNPDAFDYAQMGRQLADGKGFSTLQVFPKHIRYFHETGRLEKENWPNLYRSPLPIILNAVFYKITGQVVTASVIRSGLFYLLSIPLLYLLAVRLTNFRVALISVIFYASDRFILLSSYDGMTESTAAFLLLCLLLVCFSKNISIAKCLLAGIICGLGYLARTHFITVIPVVIVLIWMNLEKNKRAVGFALLSAGFLLVTAPWFIRNTVITGNPDFSFFNSRRLALQSVPEHSDLEMQLNAPISTIEVLKEYRAGIADKVLRNLSKILSLSFWADNFLLASLFLFLFFASCIYRPSVTDGGYRLLRLITLLLFLFNFLLVSLVLHDIRFWVHLRPLVYIIGINEALHIFDNFRLKYAPQFNLIVFYCLLFFALIGLYNTVTFQKDRTSPARPAETASYESIKQIVRPDTLIASDVAYKVALYAGCRGLRLPAYPENLLKINEAFIAVDYILLSPRVLTPRPPNQPSTYETYADYLDFVKSEKFQEEFKFVKILPDRSALFESTRSIGNERTK